MWECLCLLLPLAALSGWLIGRRSLHRTTPSGMHFLLAQKPHQAIDAFVKILDEFPDSVETILALGHFFRRRGEVARAIRLHENLIAKPSLTSDERCQALLGLAQDYYCAGVYDRAESLLLEINQTFGSPLQVTLKYLLDIYEREKDWQKAIDTAKSFQAKTGQSMGLRITHYYCEMAQIAFSKGKIKTAFKYLKQARQQASDCDRIDAMQAFFEQKLSNQSVLTTSFEPQLTYRCQACGFVSRLLSWQCPSCRGWSVFKPIDKLKEPIDDIP